MSVEKERSNSEPCGIVLLEVLGILLLQVCCPRTNALLEMLKRFVLRSLCAGEAGATCDTAVPGEGWKQGPDVLLVVNHRESTNQGM